MIILMSSDYCNFTIARKAGGHLVFYSLLACLNLGRRILGLLGTLMISTQKSLKKAKFGQCLYLVVHVWSTISCEQKGCAGGTVISFHVLISFSVVLYFCLFYR